MEFRYDAVDSQGQTVSGHISANSEREATRLLRARALTPLQVDPADKPSGSSPGRGKRATEKQKAIVIRELATLLHAGVPLAEAIESIGQSHTDSAIGQAFMNVHARLRSGESFSQGLRSAGLEWPEYLFQMVAAGEHTGKLADALHGAATHMEYELRFKSELRNALLYPGVLVVSGIGATLLIFVVVVPKFANILKSSRAQVPDLSVWVLTAGIFIKEHFLWVAMAATVAIMTAFIALANPLARARALQLLCRMPILGTWLVETETGRWAAMLSTLLRSRVPLLRALELAQEGIRLAAVKHKLQQVLREVRGGKKLGDALATVGVLNVMGLNLVRVGERSGELAGMLGTLAAIHETAGRERLKQFLTLLEPVAILLIGGIIGVIMVAVMLAITSLTNIPL